MLGGDFLKTGLVLLLAPLPCLAGTHTDKYTDERAATAAGADLATRDTVPLEQKPLPAKLHSAAKSTAVVAAQKREQGPGSPLDYSYYAKFPDLGGTGMADPPEPTSMPAGTHAGLQRFHEMLARMRRARDELREDCIGKGSGKMTRRVRDAEVLIWPEQFKTCEEHAALLVHGNRYFEFPLQLLNKTFGAQYALPKGDPSDTQAWQRRKAEFQHFPQSGCDEASRSILFSGQPGFAEPAEQIYQRMKTRCPARWVALFEPEEAIKKRAQEARKRCRPGTSYFVVDEKSGNGAREECDESDKFIPPESAKDRRSEKQANALEDDLAAIQRGEFERPTATGESASSTQAILMARRRAGAGLAAAMEESVRQQPKAGSVGGVEIFGGQTGRMLEAVAAQALPDTTDAGSNIGAATAGCDDQAEARGTENMQSARVATIRTLPLAQQECAAAKLYVDIYARALAYAQRCNRHAETPSIQNAHRKSREEASRICIDAAPSRPAATAVPYQAPRSASPPPRSPTAPARPSDRNRCATSLPC